jgi:PKD repeat protein
MRPRSSFVLTPALALLIAAVPVATASAATSPGRPASTAVPAGRAAAPAVPITSGVVANYQMNEPAGSTVMTDSSGNGLNGTIDPTGVQTGATFNGATGYNWVHRDPTAAPPSPERIIQVPDNAVLDPGSGPFTVEIRYRTPDKFGNIIQKGQAQTAGGQWKIQLPGGTPQCLFKGSLGQVAIGSTMPINDNQWHTLTCTYSSTGVVMYIDGVFNNQHKGSAGVIDNSFPMTVGGKIACDQVAVTCDYFSGQIDYVKITKGNATGPTAAFTSSCTLLACSFDGTGSTDTGGTITAYAWTFGDGGTSTSSKPTHTYAAAGSYSVSLKVTDSGGLTNTLTKTVSVSNGTNPGSVAFVGVAASAANSASPTVTVPSGTAAGDRLVMVLSVNDLTRTIGTPTGVTGWTQLDKVVAGSMSTTVWTKVAAAGNGGAAVHVPLSAAAKTTLTVADYSGVDPAATLTFAHATDTVSHTARVTPLVTATAGSWVVSYWADKSSTTTKWTPAGSVTTRATPCGSPSGQICSAFADSGTALSAGSYGGISASTNAASSAATMYSIVLPAAP